MALQVLEKLLELEAVVTPVAAAVPVLVNWKTKVLEVSTIMLDGKAVVTEELMLTVPLVLTAIVLKVGNGTRLLS